MISLKRQFINATIAERYATIIYSFDFENSGNVQNRSDELRFAITIDPDAFIAGFTADIDGELFIGRTEEKEEAKQEYTAAKEKNENAILISQPNKDISNVFEIKTNIDCGSKISLNITIEQYLKKQFGYNQLNIQLLNDFRNTTISKSYNDIGYKFIIKDKRGISSLIIPLYNGSIDNKNKFIYDIAGTITSQQLSLTNELVLQYKVDGEADESSLLFDQKTNTFCHVISDILTDAQEENANADMEGGDNYDGDQKMDESISIPRRVVFVIDKSGSMSGNKWNYSVKATIMALKKLRNGIDRYRIILCGSQLDYIPKNINILELVEESNINDSIKYLQAQRASGAELLNKGLLEGIKAIKYDIIKLNNDGEVEYNFYMNQIIFISDGRPTIGETNVDKIIKNVKNANDISKIDKYSNKISVFSFGVGRDGNGSQWMNDLPHAFLKSMSVNNNGFYKRIKQKTADTELTQYIDILSKPISTNIKVKYESHSQQPNISDLTQTKFNSLYKGNDLVICGKLDLNKKSVTKSIIATISAIRCKQIEGKNTKLLFKPITINKTLKMNVDYGDDDNKDNETQNVERIWAYLSLQQYATTKLKYNDMIEMDDDEQKEEDKAPLQLAMKYKFVTPWTSMIVVKQKTGKDKHIHTDDQKQEQKSVHIPPPQPSTGVTHSLYKVGKGRRGKKKKKRGKKPMPRRRFKCHMSIATEVNFDVGKPIMPDLDFLDSSSRPLPKGPKKKYKVDPLEPVDYRIKQQSSSLSSYYCNMPKYLTTANSYKESEFSLSRILKELKDLEGNNDGSFSAGPISDDATIWNATIIGPYDSPYAGYMFNLEIIIPFDYPMKPPKCKFITKIYHCNINKNGEIGLDVLNNKWSPVMTIKKLLLEIIKLLSHPNVNHPLVSDIGKLCKEDRKQYDKIAKEWTKYAEKFQSGGIGPLTMPDL